jgi:RNA polymerase sigma-70 factor (ECF subfamily)
MRLAARAAASRARAGAGLDAEQLRAFESLYCDYFDFVYRSLRRLGVAASSVEDALQEVYLVVLRHIDRYQPGTHPKAWLFAITHRVASNYRRTRRRRHELSLVDADELISAERSPFDRAVQRQAQRLLHQFLESVGDNQRSVFIMAELELMTGPEIAHALGENLNTIYARLRAARKQFTALARARGTLESDDG